MSKLFTVSTISILGGASLCSSFQHLPSTNHGRLSTRPTPSTLSSLQLSPSDLADPSFVAGSFLWGLNFYYGFDWLLAPLGTGLDSDFNPAYRTATFLGSLQSGKSLQKAIEISNGPQYEDGERPEMGSRIGSGANVGYQVELGGENGGEANWLQDRELGLKSSAPLVLQLGILVLYGLVGGLAMGVTGSLQTAFVLAIPALVYEIGRPSLPTREEAILDARLDQAVEAFCSERVLVYGEDQDTGMAPVRRDEATNERELVNVFKRDLAQQQNQQQQTIDLRDLSDFQIEMRFRELGTGRSEGGYIKGLRLLQEPLSKTKESKQVETTA